MIKDSTIFAAYLSKPEGNYASWVGPGNRWWHWLHISTKDNLLAYVLYSHPTPPIGIFKLRRTSGSNVHYEIVE